MRVLLVRNHQEPQIVNVQHSLEAFQQLVGGMIEVLEPFEDNVVLVCDENGRCSGKPVNRIVADHLDVCGDFFVCGSGDTDLKDMPEELIFKYASMFRLGRNNPNETVSADSWYQLIH